MTMHAEINPEIDEIDRKIIRALQAEGRLSFRDLSARIHLSPNATAERVRHLQVMGIIRGFYAEIDQSKLGLFLQAYIDVQLQPGTSAQHFESAAMKLPNVVSIAVLTGAFDCRLRVACKDQADLMQLVETLRSRAGVRETNSTVILREIHTNRTTI